MSTNLKNNSQTFIPEELFPIEIFPKKIQEIIFQVSSKLNFNLDYSSVIVLFTFSVAIGSKYKIQVKKGWLEMANLFIGIIGSAGVNKSAPLSIFTHPLERLEKKLFNQYQEDYKTYLKSDKKENLAEPIRRQIIVKDITQEGLVHGLSQNSHGFGGIYDELGSFIKNFNRYAKNGGDEEAMLSLFSSKSLSITRRSSFPLYVDSPYFSVIGSLQPSILVDLFANQRVKNGFTHRFLWAFPENIKREPLSNEEIPDAILNSYCNIIDQIVKKEFTDNPQEKIILNFATDGFEAYKKFRATVDEKINAERSDDIKGIYAKLDTYCIRIALIIQIAHFSCGEDGYSEYEINKKSVEKACLAIQYFEKSALKVFSLLDRLRDPLVSYPQEYKIFYYQLPEQFSTKMAHDICNGRFGRRTLFNLLEDNYLFSKIKHGHYSKNW